MELLLATILYLGIVVCMMVALVIVVAFIEIVRAAIIILVNKLKKAYSEVIRKKYTIYHMH